jgi:hypothetical protein
VKGRRCDAEGAPGAGIRGPFGSQQTAAIGHSFNHRRFGRPSLDPGASAEMKSEEEDCSLSSSVHKVTMKK